MSHLLPPLISLPLSSETVDDCLTLSPLNWVDLYCGKAGLSLCSTPIILDPLLLPSNPSYAQAEVTRERDDFAFLSLLLPVFEVFK